MCHVMPCSRSRWRASDILLPVCVEFVYLPRRFALTSHFVLCSWNIFRVKLAKHTNMIFQEYLQAKVGLALGDSEWLLHCLDCVGGFPQGHSGRVEIDHKVGSLELVVRILAIPVSIHPGVLAVTSVVCVCGAGATECGAEQRFQDHHARRQGALRYSSLLGLRLAC